MKGNTMTYLQIDHVQCGDGGPACGKPSMPGWFVRSGWRSKANKEPMPRRRRVSSGFATRSGPERGGTGW